MEETPRLAETIVETAAEALAAAWRQRRLPSSEAAELCENALRTVLSGHTARLLQALEALREQLESVLAQARKCVSGT